MNVATWLTGDVFQRMTELPDRSVDLIVTSPPFLALRTRLTNLEAQQHAWSNP